MSRKLKHLLTFNIKCNRLIQVKYFDWDKEKNKKLKEERGISFEDMRISIEDGRILDIITHPNINRYPNQKIYLIEFNNYVYIVPFVEDKEKIFIKTIIPSRKMTKKYLKGGVEK